MKIACFSAVFRRGSILTGRSIRRVFHYSLVGVMLWITLVNPAHAEGNVDPYIATADYWSQQWCDSGCVTPQPISHGTLCEIAGGVKTSPDEACRALMDAYIKAQICRGNPQANLATGYLASARVYPECFIIFPGGGAMSTDGILTTACPGNSTPDRQNNPTTCTCKTGYVPDATRTSCVPIATCPVTPLTQPPFSDACSTSLEQGKGVDVNNKCDPLRDDMKKAANCIADKIKALSSPKLNYSGPSATVRTAEYQNHLREIWAKSQLLDTIENGLVYSPEIMQVCEATYLAVKKEKADHGIKHQPSSSGDAAPHVERRAIDVPEAVAKALIKQVTVYTTTYTTVNGKKLPTKTITSNVEDYIHSATVNPPGCDSNISWGGLFKRYDPVHFQLP